MMKKAEEEERAELEDGAARVLQRAWTRHCEWEKMRLRFCLRRKARAKLTSSGILGARVLLLHSVRQQRRRWRWQ